MSGEVVPVTGADREAAADAVRAYRDRKNADWLERIRDGKCNDGGMVQAFARHRLAALSTPAVGTGEGMRERAYEALRKLQQGQCDEPLTSKLDRREIDDIATMMIAFCGAAPVPATREGWLRKALDASLAKRSVATMDPPWTAAFNAALDMVARDTVADLVICPNCDGSGYGVADTLCSRCNGSGGVPYVPSAPQSDAGDGWRTIQMRTAREWFAFNLEVETKLPRSSAMDTLDALGLILPAAPTNNGPAITAEGSV